MTCGDVMPRVWRAVYGESILAGTPLGYLSVQLGGGINGAAPLMAAEHSGSGL